MSAFSVHLSLRLLALGLGTVLVQIAGFSQLSFLGATPDIAPLVLASVALLAGLVPGAVFGFGIGLLIDLALLQTLGVSSLVYVIVGWFCGGVRESIRDSQVMLLPLVLGAIATLMSLVLFSLLQFLLGVEAPVSLELLRQIISTVLITTLLALPVHAVVRRLLAPALPEGTRRRRRRPPRPGLSPLISP